MAMVKIDAGCQFLWVMVTTVQCLFGLPIWKVLTLTFLQFSPNSGYLPVLCAQNKECRETYCSDVNIRSVLFIIIWLFEECPVQRAINCQFSYTEHIEAGQFHSANWMRECGRFTTVPPSTGRRIFNYLIRQHW